MVAVHSQVQKTAKKSALYNLGNFPINVKVFPNKKEDKMVTDELVKGCV